MAFSRPPLTSSAKNIFYDNWGLQVKLQVEHGVAWAWWALAKKRGTLAGKAFSMNGQEYPYFVHPYNRTWANERAVEIPVVRSFLEESQGKRVLEVGNVLSHYGPVTHQVLDKYERFARIFLEYLF